MERKLDDVGPKSFNREMTFDSGSILGIVSLFKKPWWAFPTNFFLPPIIILTHFFLGGGVLLYGSDSSTALVTKRKFLSWVGFVARDKN